MTSYIDLDAWREAPRKRLAKGNDPVSNAVIKAARDRTVITIRYNGGSEPGRIRKIRPLDVFQLLGDSSVTYCTAYCELRREERTFRLDRVELIDAASARTLRPASNVHRPPQPKSSDSPTRSPPAESPSSVLIWILLAAAIFLALYLL